jgi:protein-S-isoprenylcysteine O-methyltransferase Ste14
MYVSWTLMAVGTALLWNTIWVLVPMPFVLLYVHFIDIKREEKLLEERFGGEYAQYSTKVRRYL